jgi:hypothetical protein
MQTIMICLYLRGEKLGTTFNMRHFYFKAINACSMILQKDEYRQLNISTSIDEMHIDGEDGIPRRWYVLPLKGERYPVWVG